jgi:hypothetical protein
MTKSKQKRRFTIGWILLGIIGLIIIIRLILPVVLLWYINRELDKHPDYDGEVGGLSLSILDGSYELKSIQIFDVYREEKEPFFEVERITIDIDYGSLLKGKFLGAVVMDNPVVFIIQKPSEAPAPKDVDADVQQASDDLVPVTLERFRINNGKIKYRDLTSKPVLNMEVWALNLTVSDLSTLANENKLLPASLKGSAIVTGGGKLDVTASFDPLNEVPTFDMNFELQHLKLAAYNNFIKDAVKLHVVAGTFSLHTEIAAHDGFFTGYAKPIIDSLEITPLAPEETGLLQRIYESGATVIRDILEAPGEEQVALRLPIEGRFDDPDAKIWTAVITLLKNAFIEALVPSIDHSVNIGQVREVIEEKSTKK